MPKLSIVSTLYRSAEFIDELVARVSASAAAVTDDYEIILVDDGSPDASLAMAVAEARRNARVSVVELSRNFGHHPAILAGLAAAKGDRVFYIDSDIEEPPEELPRFWQTMDELADVVFGIHAHVEGSWLRRFTSRTFWRLFNLLSETETQPNICNMRLMSRAYVDALLSMPERNVFLGGMFAWAGFKQSSLTIERTMRRAQSTYSWWARIKLSSRSIVSFSTRPLEMLFALGLMISSVSMLGAIGLVVQKVLHPGTIIPGITVLLVSIWLLSGLILSGLGLVGLYIAYVYKEVKQRPLTVVRRVHQFAALPRD